MIALRDFETCAFCPRLCRHVCPVAVGSGREAATPTSMMTGTWSWLSELGTAEQAVAYASLCVDCGACTRACKLQRPVGELLGDVLRELDPAPPGAAPLGTVEGEGRYVALETDERPWHRALGERLAEPVARLRTPDQLGAAHVEHGADCEGHLAALARLLEGRILVVADAGSLGVATEAGVEVVHLAALVDPPPDRPWQPTCRGPGPGGGSPPDLLGCCGGRAPLSQHHPAVAAEVAADAARRLGETPACIADAHCGARLRGAGARLSDPVDWLMGAS